MPRDECHAMKANGYGTLKPRKPTSRSSKFFKILSHFPCTKEWSTVSHWWTTRSSMKVIMVTLCAKYLCRSKNYKKDSGFVIMILFLIVTPILRKANERIDSREESLNLIPVVLKCSRRGQKLGRTKAPKRVQKSWSRPLIWALYAA